MNYEYLSKEFSIPVASVKAIASVESNGAGFDEKTGKIKIQFEPAWFKRFTGISVANGIEGQKEEWKAFNTAFAADKDKAMQSTSWGLMQVMGFNYKRLGFKNVGEMVDFAKVCETNQLWLGLKFIATDKKLYNALLNKDWAKVAYYYNGSNYAINQYDKKLKEAYLKFS
jgi:hypothetical protein